MTFADEISSEEIHGSSSRPSPGGSTPSVATGSTPGDLPRSREWAEAALRRAGLTPDRTGPLGWEQAILEAQDAATDREVSSATRRPGPMLLTAETLAAWQERNRREASKAEIAAAERERARLPEPVCPTCDGARFVYTRAIGAGPHDVAPCECMPLRERAAWSGIDRRYQGATLDTFEPLDGKAEALEACRAWDGRRSVVLTGETWGTGKTHLGVGLLMRRLAEGGRARFVSVPDFLEGLRSRFDPNAGDQAQAYAERYAAEPLLMLDDLGAERVTDWTREAVRVLIDRRYRLERPTIVTTNCASEGELADYIGGAVVSRLRDAMWIRVAGADMRGRG